MAGGNGWLVRYGNLLLDGCGDLPCPTLAGLTRIGTLTDPPAGISGWGELGTTDITYAGTDGSKFGRDYYAGRQITLSLAVGGENCCGDDMEARAAVRALLNTWRRACDDQPLIIYPPGCTACDDTDPDGLRPVRVNGRPRVAQVEWQSTTEPIALVTLRFDTPDVVLDLADCCGEPGTQCVDLHPGVANKTRCYCEPGSYRCYSHEVVTGEGVQQRVFIGGTECVCPTITAHGLLTNPRWVNLQTGGRADWRGTLPAGATLTIDPCEGTARRNGTDVTRSLFMTGDLRVRPGEESDWLFTSFGAKDTGYSTVCWDPGVMTA